MTTLSIVLACCLAVSEVLGGIPSVASNSIYQVVLAVLKQLVPSSLSKKQ